MVPQTLFPTPEASALMSGTSASLLAAAASSPSNLQAEAARHFLHQLSSSHALNPPSQVDLRESAINNADLGGLGRGNDTSRHPFWSLYG